jgi:hypothetical protein
MLGDGFRSTAGLGRPPEPSHSQVESAASSLNQASRNSKTLPSNRYQ